MSDVDFALAWHFIDDQGRPRQLRFRHNYVPPADPSAMDGTGQLIAVIANGSRADNGDEIAVTRAGVSLSRVESAIEGWQCWATLYAADNDIDRWLNLAEVQRRVDAAGLGIEPSR